MLLYVLRSMSAPFGIRYLWLTFAAALGLTSSIGGYLLVEESNRGFHSDATEFNLYAPLNCWPNLSIYVSSLGSHEFLVLLVPYDQPTETTFQSFTSISQSPNSAALFKNLGYEEHEGAGCDDMNSLAIVDKSSTLEHVGTIFGRERPYNYSAYFELEEPSYIASAGYGRSGVPYVDTNSIPVTAREGQYTFTSILGDPLFRPSININDPFNVCPEVEFFYTSEETFSGTCYHAFSAASVSPIFSRVSFVDIASLTDAPLSFDDNELTLQDIDVDTPAYASGILYKVSCQDCLDEFEQTIGVYIHDWESFTGNIRPDSTQNSSTITNIYLSAIEKQGLLTQFRLGNLNAELVSRSGISMPLNGENVTTTGDSISWTNRDASFLSQRKSIWGSVLLGFGIAIIAEAILVGLHELARNHQTMPNSQARNGTSGQVNTRDRVLLRRSQRNIKRRNR